jgi:hypothetical protein
MKYFNFVNKYHTSHKSNYVYFGALETGKKGFQGGGLEIELDTDEKEISKSSFRNKCAEILVFNENRDHYFLEKDATLRYGFEITTQPHTVEAMYEFIDNMADAFAELSKTGATDEARRAGLHIHLSKTFFGEEKETRKENIAKLLYFFANHPEEIKKLGRRKSMKKCKVLPLVSKEQAIDYVEQTYGVTGLDRYLVDRDVALNIRNKSTIEFRAMQTTLNTEILKAEFALTLWLAEKSRTITWEDANSWDKWFEGTSQEILDYTEMALSRVDEPEVEEEIVEDVVEEVEE